ncbi:MAG: oligosaccharide flippase family protein [Candidatus Acidiferrales bacterium]
MIFQGKLEAIADRLRREPVGAALLGLASDSGVYLMGALLIGLGNFVLVPLYTRYLAPSEFGVYALVDVAILLLVTVTQLKFDVSYLKWFSELELSRRGELLSTVLAVGGLGSAVAGTVLSALVLSHAGHAWLGATTRSFGWFLLPLVVFENLQGILLTDLRARRHAVGYSTVAVCRLFVIVGATYYLLAIDHEGIRAVFAGRLVGDAAGLLILAVVCLKKMEWRFRSSLLKPMLQFGIPLIWSVIAVTLQDASGRYFLSRHGSLEAVGLLASAIKLGAIFQVLVNNPFGVAWGGMLFQIVKLPNARMVYSKIFSYVYVMSIGIALILTVLGPTLFRLFTSPAYYSASVVLPLILLVRTANLIEQPASTGIYLAGRTGLLSVLYTVALCVNLTLLYLLVPKYGILGVGWAWLLASALVPVLMVIAGRKIYPLTFNWKLMVLPLLPWVLVLGRGTWSLASFSSSGYLIWQLLLCLAIIFGAVILVLHDFRMMRRGLRAGNTD